jgi:hypothetical protein
MFETVSWACCLLTSALLLILVGRWRYLAVKPSIVVIVGFHLMIQWAATVHAADVEAYLPRPWAFVLLAQGFPLMGLAGTLVFGRRAAQQVWGRVARADRIPRGRRSRAIALLLLCVAVGAVVFLSYVPIRQTGLYAILSNPSMAALAREDSLKLLPSALVRYLYNFLVAAFCPITAVLLSTSFLGAVRRLRIAAMAAILGAIGGLLAFASLTGARSYPAAILLAMVLAWLLQQGLRVRLLAWVVPGMLCVLAIPVTLTVLREGHALTAGSFFLYLRTGILQRLFFIPMQTGLWHVHYAETSGLIGIAGIPKLAALMNVDAINVANLIARLYTHTTVASELANTSYVFSYYAYFGLPSVLFSLFGLWLLDSALWVYGRLSDTLLLPCVATVMVASLGFVAVDYTVGLVTNGFLPALGVALVTDQVVRVRLRIRPRDVSAPRPRGTNS